MRTSKTFWLGLFGVAAGVAVAALAAPYLRSTFGDEQRDNDSARVDEASEESFPASDPPSFSTPATAVPGPAS